MTNAMDALHKAQADQYNTLRRYKDDLLLYGTYSLNSTLGVLDTLEGMQLNQASLSDTISNLPSGEWPLFYLTKTGLYRYVLHLSLHALTLHHKVDFLYETLIKEIQSLVKGIATLSKGYLPPELFPPSFLRNITHRVARELTNDHKGYKLAFDHESAYYDMQLTTFSLDQWFNLIVTFPVFIVPLHHQPLNLYEIETTPVLIDDADPTAHSYSEVEIDKPYIAASNSSYIQLRETELFRCKVIQGEYFCEESFMVKHTHHHTCESAIFFNRTPSVITEKCNFKFYHNRTVVPSVLDGGDQLVLANVKVEHSPTCDPRHLPSLPTREYTLTNRSILCNCMLQMDLAHLLADLGACADSACPVHFTSNPNIAFETLFRDILSMVDNSSDQISPDRVVSDLQATLPDQHDFDLNLTLPYNASRNLDYLRDAHFIFSRNLSSSSTPSTDTSYILSEEYQAQIKNIKKMISSHHEERFLAEHYSEIFATVSLAATLFNTLVLFKIFKDHRKLKALTVALSMVKTAHSLTLPAYPTPPTPNEAKVLCYDPIISGLLTLLSTLSVGILIYQQLKDRNPCKGYLYSNIIEVKLVIGETSYYIPLKLRKLAGQLHRMKINAMPHPSQFTLVRNCVWDTLAIDWLDIELRDEGEVIGLPNTVVIPLCAKYKVRSLLNKDFHVSLALCQGNTWYDLTANSRAPIHRLVARVANTRNRLTAPFVVTNPNRYDCPQAPQPRRDARALNIPSDGSAFQMVEQSPYRSTTQEAAHVSPPEENEQPLDLRVQNLENETFV